MQEEAYQAGYKNGQADVRLGSVNRYSYFAGLSSSEFEREYSRGYRQAVAEAQRRGYDVARAELRASLAV
jgi:hypothetical protein